MTKPTADLSEYTGPLAKCEDPQHAAVLLESSTVSKSIYRPGTVDHVFFAEAVVLTSATVEALYDGFTPLSQRFVPGSRPFLEKIVERVTSGLTDERAKAIALLDWIRDIPHMYARHGKPGQNGNNDPFHGGTEEEIIRKGSSMCNEQARVLCILAQIAGIPSRYIGHMVPIDYDDPKSGTGHGVSELYIEGAWAYFDNRGKYFVKSDGKLASTWDVISEHSLIDNQPQEVLDHLEQRSSMESSHRWFSPAATHVIVNYLATDHHRYDYSWVFPSRSLWAEAREKGRALRTSKHIGIMPQPKPRV